MLWIGAFILAMIFIAAATGRPSPILFGIGAAALFMWYWAGRDKTSRNPVDSADSEFPVLPPLAEASAEFDLPDLNKLLNHISKCVEIGFPTKVVDHITSLAQRMRQNAEKHLQYEVCFRGKFVPLHIDLFKADPNGIGAVFFTHPELAKIIDSEIDSLHA